MSFQLSSCRMQARKAYDTGCLTSNERAGAFENVNIWPKATRGLLLCRPRGSFLTYMPEQKKWQLFEAALSPVCLDPLEAPERD